LGEVYQFDRLGGGSACKEANNVRGVGSDKVLDQGQQSQLLEPARGELSIPLLARSQAGFACSGRAI
jgi:hypothetical protein